MSSPAAAIIEPRVTHRLVATFRDGTVYDILECYSLWTLRKVARSMGFFHPMWKGQRTFSSSVDAQVPA